MSEEYIEEGINGQWTDWKFEAENYKKICEHLQQENKQLKKDYAQIVSDNCDYLKLEQQRDLYKEVVKEVREHIEKNLSFCENDSQGAYEVCAIRIASDKKLLQMLDKAKGE